VLPVVGVPELVLAHLVGHDGLTDADLDVLERVLGRTCVQEDRYTLTMLGGVLHSFDDEPSERSHQTGSVQYHRNGAHCRRDGKPVYMSCWSRIWRDRNDRTFVERPEPGQCMNPEFCTHHEYCPSREFEP
jgi:hypothetical protein